MLELKKIKKDYATGYETVHALKGISLQFRNHEFVSILGPSGCGKTTLLNIIGGLDQYTSGDLVINGTSTKFYRDRDWDAYRNYTIGFVFQSYNLIPHQTVLQNVELALTLSGVSQRERHARAKEALSRVGLSTQLNKRPQEMSGGQMQRVAIARAIVNNPDIILADEPTGALDTETSKQVMDILKEISKERLVIMVTHNPDLAEHYSTRIIRMLDGVLQEDSNPIGEEELQKLKEEDRNPQKNFETDAIPAKVGQAHKRKFKKKPTMSFFTSFGLSLKNLFSKKGRTLLTSFAGSIGIIGIALIYAVSQGTTDYIAAVQEETLSSYPLTIQSENTDLTSLITTLTNDVQETTDHELDAVYKKTVLVDLINALTNLEVTQNDLASFKKYLDAKMADTEDPDGIQEILNGIKYSYGYDFQVLTKNADGNIIESDSSKLMSKLLVKYMGSSGTSMNTSSSALYAASSSSGIWQEMLSGNQGAAISDLILKQYDLVYGSYPNSYNEVVLILDENNELGDITLYALGLLPEESMEKLIVGALTKTEVEKTTESWSYEEICGLTFKAIMPSSCYVLDQETGLYTDLRKTDTGLEYLYEHALELTVTGIIRPNKDAIAPMLSGSIGYTSMLTNYLIEECNNSEAAKEQEANPNVDLFTGLVFKGTSEATTTEEKAEELRQYVSVLSSEKKAEAYEEIMTQPDEEYISSMVALMLPNYTRAQMEAVLVSVFAESMSMDADTVSAYLATMDDATVQGYFKQLLIEQQKEAYAKELEESVKGLSVDEKARALEELMDPVSGLSNEDLASYVDLIVEYSTSTYEENMKELGAIDLSTPTSISLYASSFDNKDLLEDIIADYNASQDEYHQISYTDYVGIMMSSITTIIHAITYVLIAFVSVSLVVSSIMIGVITLISVQERTKEIGILRAVGASKKNVSSLFNAETLIIGFASGLTGVVVTYLLCIPINLILHALTGINNLSASLPLETAGILILISCVLTLFSGIIPSRSAAKKDPVVALRTE